jgi:hypothetical protein
MVLPDDRLRGGAQEQVQLNHPANGPERRTGEAAAAAVVCCSSSVSSRPFLPWPETVKMPSRLAAVGWVQLHNHTSLLHSCMCASKANVQLDARLLMISNAK